MPLSPLSYRDRYSEPDVTADEFDEFGRPVNRIGQQTIPSLDELGPDYQGDVAAKPEVLESNSPADMPPPPPAYEDEEYRKYKAASSAPMPEYKPSLLRRIAAGAVGGTAALVNSGGRVRIDGSEAVDNILGKTEYNRKRAEYDATVKRTHDAAREEDNRNKGKYDQARVAVADKQAAATLKRAENDRIRADASMKKAEQETQAALKIKNDEKHILDIQHAMDLYKIDPNDPRAISPKDGLRQIEVIRTGKATNTVQERNSRSVVLTGNNAAVADKLPGAVERQAADLKQVQSKTTLNEAQARKADRAPVPGKGAGNTTKPNVEVMNRIATIKQEIKAVEIEERDVKKKTAAANDVVMEIASKNGWKGQPTNEQLAILKTQNPAEFDKWDKARVQLDRMHGDSQGSKVGEYTTLRANKAKLFKELGAAQSNIYSQPGRPAVQPRLVDLTPPGPGTPPLSRPVPMPRLP